MPTEKTIVTEEDAWIHRYKDDHLNPFMEDLYTPDAYVLKKKANYRERLSCGLHAQDNVFKIYEWDERAVIKGKRLIRLE